MRRKVKKLSDHDVQEVVLFQQYLDDLYRMGPNADFYRKYGNYMGLSDDEVKKILVKRNRGGTSQEGRKA